MRAIDHRSNRFRQAPKEPPVGAGPVKMNGALFECYIA